MKRPNFTLNNMKQLVALYIKTNTRALSILLTLSLIYTSTQAQINCNVILACNDGVQISLDDDCNMFIEPDMILQAPSYTNDEYDVEAKLPSGVSLPSVIVGLDILARPIKRVSITSAHIGMTLQVKVSLRGCANSCWGDAVIEDKLPPVISTCPCEERITNLTGNVSTLDGTYDRPVTVAGCPGTPTLGVRYETIPFAVDMNGIVDISLPSVNTRFSLYAGTFDPLNPCTNLIETNANAYSGNLSTGTNYTLVVSSVGSGTPPGGLDYIVYLDSQTGNIKSSTTGTVCVRPCTDETNLLAQTVNNASSRPTFTDGCGGALTYTKRDSVITLTCNERFGKIIKRFWTAKDASGNISEEKVQYFYLNRGTLASIMCPADWVRSCNTSFTKLESGAPAPSSSGQPTNISCSNIQVYYDDVIFELCGAGIKVFRQWTIIDWCTGDDQICSQTIKVEDDIQPTFNCPTLANVPSLFDRCSANWAVTPPSATDCSFVSWDVLFSKDGIDQPTVPVTAVFTKSDGTTTVVGTMPAFLAQISTTARPYTINGLPLGKTWIKYIVKDECDNIRECITSVTVVDNTPPTAICEDQTVISIDDTGWAELFAESMDDHSLDNCGPITFQIKRKNTTCAGYASDLDFGPKVRFCCSDITSPTSYVSVVLRVTDAAGNYNECESTVKVQNKRPPTIVCPSNKTLTCGDPRIDAWITDGQAFDTTYFGLPTSGGICNDLLFASRIVSRNINAKCNTGTVNREWFLISNPSIKCTQRLTIISPVFSPSNVIFPDTLTLATCDLEKAKPDVLNSKPIINNTTCRDIGVSYTDQVFQNVPGVCIKILRTWRVIDWCSYPNSPVIAEKTQTIKLTGSGGAVFTGCTNKTFDADSGSCEKEVTMSATATDECTTEANLQYSWSLDLSKNGTIDASGAGSSFTRVLPKGTHRVTFTVVNRCRTPTTCSYDVTIRATKKPTPVCLREVVWVLDSDGRSEIWASDFNLKSENNCGDDSKLKYSFNAAGNQPSKTFTCADLPNGQVARIPLKMYVIDENGNFDFCDVILILQDSPLTNACTDNPDFLPTVAGRITTEMNEGVDEIEVELTNMSNATGIKVNTSNKGDYKLTGVDVFDPKTIEAHKNTDILNGVSTLDLVLIQRHILGLQELTSPYKLLAADINNSKSITAGDLVSLRKVILGVTLEFENNTSWRFVPAGYTFQDPKYPFDFPAMINLDSIFEDRNNVNFTAIKVGDINNSVVANATGNSTENRSSNALFVADYQKFEAGKTVKYEVKAGDNMDIIGAQFGLTFDANQLTYTNIKPGLFNIKSQHVNLMSVENGKLVCSFDAPNGITLHNNDVLFTIEFVAQSTGNTSSIKFDQQGLNAEVYEMDATVKPLHLQVRENNAEGIQNMLYQNEPNPFKEYTNISFELAKANTASIRILDVTGKIVYNKSARFEKGYHSITIDNQQLSKSGVYYYQIEAGEFIATKKMILIE